MKKHHQATTLMQLAQWRTALGVEEATQVLLSDDFDPEAASTGDPELSPLLEFCEMVGTLTKHGLLDAGLALDSWWVSGAWARLAPAVMKDRDKFAEPRLFETFEALAAQDQQ